jgi:hypothetical protein
MPKPYYIYVHIATTRVARWYVCKQISKFGDISEGLVWKISAWLGHYFTYLLCILWPLCIFCGHLLHFAPLGMLIPSEIWQPWPQLSQLIFLWNSREASLPMNGNGGHLDKCQCSQNSPKRFWRMRERFKFGSTAECWTTECRTTECQMTECRTFKKPSNVERPNVKLFECRMLF